MTDYSEQAKKRIMRDGRLQATFYFYVLEDERSLEYKVAELIDFLLIYDGVIGADFNILEEAVKIDKRNTLLEAKIIFRGFEDAMAVACTLYPYSVEINRAEHVEERELQGALNLASLATSKIYGRFEQKQREVNKRVEEFKKQLGMMPSKRRIVHYNPNITSEEVKE